MEKKKQTSLRILSSQLIELSYFCWTLTYLSYNVIFVLYSFI